MNQAKHYPVYVPAVGSTKRSGGADKIFRLLSRLTGNRIHPAVTMTIGCNVVAIFLLMFCPVLSLNGRLYGLLSLSSLFQDQLLWGFGTVLFAAAVLLGEAACYLYLKKGRIACQILSIGCEAAGCLLFWYILETLHFAQFALEYGLLLPALFLVCGLILMLRHNRGRNL